jgi:phosphoserine phosphatase
MTARYASVVLDVDSTVSGIEGIDWLAERRGPEVAARIVRLTEEAMRGVIPLEAIYGKRLAEIRPTRADIEALSRQYLTHLAPGCAEAVSALREAGIEVVLVSGGLLQAIEPLASQLGVTRVRAVEIRFDAGGEYASFDESSPLTTSQGKAAVVESMRLARPILAMGDGSTDVAMKPVADTFAAFTGFAARPNVIAEADLVIESFAALQSLVLS